MNKFVMAGIAASVIAVSGVATASPLVTANVPLAGGEIFRALLEGKCSL